ARSATAARRIDEPVQRRLARRARRRTHGARSRRFRARASRALAKPTQRRPLPDRLAGFAAAARARARGAAGPRRARDSARRALLGRSGTGIRASVRRGDLGAGLRRARRLSLTDEALAKRDSGEARVSYSAPQEKTPTASPQSGFRIKSLAVTYSRMGKPTLPSA